MPNSIYLDNNSTTMMHPEVAEVISRSLREGHLNPASQHASGRRARRLVEKAREQIASLLGASLAAPQQDSLIFTSGGTESNNLAIRGLVRTPGRILISSIEHPSALAAAHELESRGFCVEQIPVNPEGHVCPQQVEQMLDKNTRLVVLMLANHETGTLQPVQEVAGICQRWDIPTHCDAVQVAGKLRVDFRALGVSTLAVSAHKFHGPRGIGALLLRSRVELDPLIVGGSQQLGVRPGTESVTLATGMAKALELALADPEGRNLQISALRDRLEQTMTENCDCLVNGLEPRLPHTSNISFPGLDRQAIAMAMDFAGVELSTGSACTSGSSEPSHVLLAMGLDDRRVEGAIRLSLSSLTTASEIEEAGRRISAVIANLRREK